MVHLVMFLFMMRVLVYRLNESEICGERHQISIQDTYGYTSNLMPSK